MDKKRWNLKRAGFWLLVIWIVLLCTATAYSLYRQYHKMPAVMLIEPQAGTLSCTVEMDAVAESGELASINVSIYDNIPPALLSEGRDVGIGTILSCEPVWEGYLVTVALKEKHTAGEQLTAAFTCTPEDEFSQVVDSSALHPGIYGQPCVYELEAAQGSWGTEYRLKEISVSCFPLSFTQDQVTILTELEAPIAVGLSDEALSDGMTVRIG